MIPFGPFRPTGPVEHPSKFDDLVRLVEMITPRDMLGAMGIDLGEDYPEGAMVYPGRDYTDIDADRVTRWGSPLLRRSAEAAVRLVPQPKRSASLVERQHARFAYYKRLVVVRNEFARRAWRIVAKKESGEVA